MFNWEDGTLVKGAHVVINGVEYPVIMPEYSGNTPLTAENLNRMQRDLINDSGWKTATLSDDFKNYNNQSSSTPRYRKIGKIVQIVGVISPTEILTNSGTARTIFTLPEGYRPPRQQLYLCVGSNKNTWNLTIQVAGNVNFSRYGVSEFIDVPTNAWLPFNITFFVD